MCLLFSFVLSSAEVDSNAKNNANNDRAVAVLNNSPPLLHSSSVVAPALSFREEVRKLREGGISMQLGQYPDCPSACPSNSDYCDPSIYTWCVYCYSTPYVCYCTNDSNFPCPNSAGHVVTNPVALLGMVTIGLLLTMWM